MDIAVSVIIPTFNRGHLIAETIRSICEQSFKPSEIIVIDDGSTDDTESVVAHCKGVTQYCRIENSGVCKARNIGVDKAQGEWLAFCDSDDLWHRDKLLHQVELLQKRPDVEYCFTNFQTFQDGQWSQKTKFDDAPPGYWDVPRQDITTHSFILTEPFYGRVLKFQPIFPSTIMMKKTFFHRVGAFNEPLGKRMSEDFEFTLRCVQEHPVGVITKPLVGIRWHAQNYSRGSLPGISFMIGDIEILHYAMQHHHLGAQHRSLITEQIIARSISVAHGAFTCGKFDILQDMLKNVPPAFRSMKLWVKGGVSRLPLPLARAVQKGLMNLTGGT